MPRIIVEDDGPPIVRILGATLRRAAAQPSLARRMKRMKGRVALRSTTGPQALTIHFAGKDVHVDHGVHPATDVTISVDFNTMGRPGAPKPAVKGAARHLRLALGAAKVLDPPVAGGWAGAVSTFWDWSEGRKGRPDWLRVVCTDDGSERVCGDLVTGATTVEVHGPAWALLNVFTGGDHLGAAALEGRVRVVADLSVLSSFIGVVTALMLGEP